MENDPEENNNRAVECLWQNDPKDTTIYLLLRAFSPAMALDCAEALQWNTSAKTLELVDYAPWHVAPMEAADWIPFWKAINHSTTLKKAKLKCSPLFGLDGFLDEISKSSSIKELRLGGGTVSVNSFCTFLRTTKSVTSLSLVGLNFEGDGIVTEASRTEAACNISSSVAENTSMEVLHLAHVERLYQAALFRGLVKHTKIQKLEFGLDSSLGFQIQEIALDELESLRLALTSTKAPLKHLKFAKVYFNEQVFSIVADGIRESRYICEITLEDCQFDEISTRMLQDLFTNHALKLYSLTISGSIYLLKSFDMFVGDVLRSNVCLSELNIGHRCLTEAIVSGIEQDSLESLTIQITEPTHWQALTSNLIKMKRLRNLHLNFWRVDIPDARTLLAQALKRNCSLWQVTTDLGDTGVWALSDVDKVNMKFYAKRNKQIHAILAAPRGKVQKLRMNWPRIFEDMRGCDMEASILLLTLVALSNAVGPHDHM